MSAAARPRRGLLRGPLLPVGGIAVGIGLLIGMASFTGGESSSGAAMSAARTGPSAAPSPAQTLPAGSCSLRVDGEDQQMSLNRARTLTQIAAVGRQVKAPAEMVARTMDVTAKRKGVPSVTDALNLFTREDSTPPSARALAQLRALSSPAALTCIFSAPTGTVEKKGEKGLTPRAQATRQGLLDAFGKLKIGGTGKKALRAGEAYRDGRGLMVMVPENYSGQSSGWLLAHWLTARGATYHLDSIRVGPRAWTPVTGWSAVPAVGGAAADRVTLSVVKGNPAEKKSADEKSDSKKSGKNKSEKKKSGKNSKDRK